MPTKKERTAVLRAYKQLVDLSQRTELLLQSGREKLADALATGIAPSDSPVDAIVFIDAGMPERIDSEEFVRRVVRLLGPEFDSDEFREVSRQLWPGSVGGRFDPAHLRRLLGKLCRLEMIRQVSPRKKQKPALYRVLRRPRRIQART